MPDHVHLLICEPGKGDPSVVLKALKQRVSMELVRERTEVQTNGQARALPRLWQPRFHDFNVYTDEKEKEKLKYIHENPITRGLVKFPGEWKWSSFSFYATGQPGIIPIDLVE